MRQALLYFFTALTILSNAINTSAQNDQSSTRSKQTLPPMGFYLSMVGEGFFRNNEYKAPYGTGYTLPIGQFQTVIGYRIEQNLPIYFELGASLTLYSGAERYPKGTWYAELPYWQPPAHTTPIPHIIPLFAFVAHPSKNAEVRIGKVKRSEQHGIIDPLYSREYSHSSDPEMGVQLLWNTPKLVLDTWVDWQSFIYKNDNHQEAFVMGLNTTYNAWKLKRHMLSLSLQAIATHRGGETNWQQQAEVHSYLATGLGVNYSYIFSHNSSLRSDNNFLYGKFFLLGSAMRTTEENMKPGFAQYALFGVSWNKLTIETRFWHGERFVSPLGGPFVNTRNLWGSPYMENLPRNGYLGLFGKYSFFKSNYADLSLGGELWIHIPLSQSTKKISHAMELTLTIFPPSISLSK